MRDSLLKKWDQSDVDRQELERIIRWDLYFNYLVGVTAGGLESPRGHM